MTKKKIVILATMLSVIVAFAVGWFVFRGKVYDVHIDLNAEQMDKFSFGVKTPTKVPFKEMKVMAVEANEKQQVVISLINVDKERLDIEISEIRPDSLEGKGERIVIGDELQGKFIPNLSGRRMIMWQDGEVFYKITFYPKLTPREVSKRQLVKMAESFK